MMRHSGPKSTQTPVYNILIEFEAKYKNPIDDTGQIRYWHRNKFYLVVLRYVDGQLSSTGISELF